MSPQWRLQASFATAMMVYLLIFPPSPQYHSWQKTETWDWEEGGSEGAVQNEGWKSKGRPRESPCFSSRPLMSWETEERRIDEWMERRRRTVLWGRCVSRSWGGFISCQCGVSLPANWLQRLKVSEVSERKKEAEEHARSGGRFPSAPFTLPLSFFPFWFISPS